MDRIWREFRIEGGSWHVLKWKPRTHNWCSALRSFFRHIYSIKAFLVISACTAMKSWWIFIWIPRNLLSVVDDSWTSEPVSPTHYTATQEKEQAHNESGSLLSPHQDISPYSCQIAFDTALGEHLLELKSPYINANDKSKQEAGMAGRRDDKIKPSKGYLTNNV
jgi:hypothetical protein